MIGDGMGYGQLAAARSEGSLDMETLPLSGALRTLNAHGQVTGSGASATALATGVKTYNGAIGVGVNSEPLQTIVELAEEHGMATGLVTTTSVTDATPAAFAAHTTFRGNQFSIAEQLADAGLEILLGGGARFFRPEARPDGVDLLAGLRTSGCEVLLGADQLTDASPQSECIVGLFNDSYIPLVNRSREPSLPDMAEFALERLMEDGDGFFLMIEGGRIDPAGHANDLPLTRAETREFDAAVTRVRGMVESRPNTLLLVTADHETGGLTPDTTQLGVTFSWESTEHTARLVPLFGSIPPGLSFPDDTLENSRLGEIMLRFVGTGN